MPMQISGVTIQGGMNILPRAGAPSPAPTPGPAPGPSDPDFSNVVFMFDGDGTDGGANNTFTDASTNGHTITETGSVIQGSFSPYGDNWSNYFDGASNADLVIADSDNLSAEDQDFTLEAWVYVENAGGSNKAIWSKWGSGTQEILLGISSNNLVAYISTYGVATPLLTSSTSVGSGWNHVALTRNGNDFDLWLNGVNTASATQAGSIQNQTADVTIGDYVDGGWQYYGYISNLRWVKGTAIYTSAFTPSAAPLTAITNTQLLTCQSNRFVDNSSNAHTITVNGDTEVTPFNPFTNSDARTLITDGGSAYFDGDYLQTPNSASLNLSSGNWTMEGWIYALGDGYGKRYVILEGSSRTFGLVRGNNNTFEWNFFGTRAEIISSTNSFHLNTWVHFALVSNSTNITLYIDGVSQGTTTNYPDNSAHYVTVGASTIRYPGTDSNAYVSDLRIVRGTAVYTANFTPPTAPLTAVTNTELLLNFQDSAIYDYSGQNNIDTVGNTQIDTAIKKYGTGSVKFDGSGDYLIAGENPNLAPGAGDFTVEFWMYGITNTFYNGLYHNYPDAINRTTAFRIVTNTADQTSLLVSTAATTIITTASGVVTANAWNHVALVRNGSSLVLYVNGVSAGSTTNTTNFSDGYAIIGDAAYGGTNYFFNGYIDDFRLTKGIARYTTNFTPPTAALPKF